VDPARDVTLSFSPYWRDAITRLKARLIGKSHHATSSTFEEKFK
jgi:hypothetical protein